MATSKSPIPFGLRLAAALILVAFLWYARGKTPPPQPDPRPSRPEEVTVVGPETEPLAKQPAEARPLPVEKTPEDPGADETRSAPAKKSLVITNLKLKDETGRVIYQGDIDLQPTLDRIAAGDLLDRFRNDGSTFQNRERRLPRQPAGYYQEYVVPTPGERGPGPQRVVLGKDGEVYYTSDHYKSFRRIR